jgi:transcriptional regulator with XRE-family HTH domain
MKSIAKKVSNLRVNEFDKIIGAKLKIKREQLGISQVEMGRFIDVSTQQIQKYEKGKNRISASNLFTLCDFLKTSITDFYNKKSHGRPTLSKIHGKQVYLKITLDDAMIEVLGSAKRGKTISVKISPASLEAL